MRFAQTLFAGSFDEGVDSLEQDGLLIAGACVGAATALPR